MPIHDWTRVPAGVVHHLHGSWLFELAGELNEGILPAGYYALGEQVMSGAVLDVLTLERVGESESSPGPTETEDSVPAPEPRAALTAIAEDPRYRPPARVLSIRHVSGDRVVAFVEIVSSGNKREAAELGSLVDKTVHALSRGISVVLVDLWPPGRLDVHGLHNVIWNDLGQESGPFDGERPLQVVSYVGRDPVKAFIEPRAVGETLPDASLFLSTSRYVALPLETSYRRAFERLPAHIRRELEPTS